MYFSCSDSCFLLALIYIIRFLDFCPDFVVNAFSIHRLLAISLVVSVKFHEDKIYSNAFYAKVTGLRQEELNAGELEFLKLILGDKVKGILCASFCQSSTLCIFLQYRFCTFVSFCQVVLSCLSQLGLVVIQCDRVVRAVRERHTHTHTQRTQTRA
eukprot:Skav218378  [mRNA]  locus=scaffold2066:267886:269482:- [translate_table: standard]